MMPRLVLLEDDGSQVFAGDLSRANFVRLVGFLRRNQGVIGSAAAAIRTVRAACEAIALMAAAPPRTLPRNSRRRGGRA